MKKSLNQIPGTVAYVMTQKIESIDFGKPFSQVKAQVIEVLKSPEITQRKAADKFIQDVQNMRNLSQLLSTVGTYLTGEKVS